MVFQKITYPKYETGILSKPAAKTPKCSFRNKSLPLRFIAMQE